MRISTRASAGERGLVVYCAAGLRDAETGGFGRGARLARRRDV
jgi:hypothetical protein